MSRQKPVPGHKLASYSYGVSVRCECGWRSATAYGKGARSEAAKLWRSHREGCAPPQDVGAA